MNLLPQPRRATFTGDVVAASPARYQHDPALAPEGYRLRIGPSGVDVTHGDPAGRFYADQTLAQLAHVNDGRLPAGEIDDWPDLPVRGVMLDVSRDKVPTLHTLEALIDRLAGWKVNQVQLYIEHTFAYRGRDEVWRDASPFTADEIRRLDAYCRDRFVELVPNQNCLGHMERWLKHPTYAHLAANPDGWRDPTGRMRPPTTIDPVNPESLTLVRGLLAELLPCFTSSWVHVGLDEPWELGPERFGDYLAFLRGLRAAPELDGHEALMWGDIVAHHPDQLESIPDGMTVCEWGYDAGHPFEERLSALQKAGRPAWVCPGTSSWNTVLGRTTNARDNVREAMQAGLAGGAGGLLNTDWGDNGHLQYLPVSEPGFAFGAAAAWCLETNADIDLAAALDAHVFADQSGRLGAALLALGDAHRLVAPQVPNNSILCVPLYYPWAHLGTGLTAGLTVADFAAVETAIHDAVRGVEASTSARADAGLVRDELTTAAELVLLCCADARARIEAGADGTIGSVAETIRRQLGIRLRPLIERHRLLWLARNRPGGLDDSVAVLRRMEAGYRAAG